MSTEFVAAAALDDGDHVAPRRPIDRAGALGLAATLELVGDAADEAAVLFPHRDPQRLAGEHHAGHPRAVGAQLRDVAVEHRVDECLAGDPVAAQSVQDRFRKAGALGKFGIAVQRIAVAAEAIDQRLVGPGRDIDRFVG